MSQEHAMAQDLASTIDANRELPRDHRKSEYFLQSLNCHSSLLRKRKELCQVGKIVFWVYGPDCDLHRPSSSITHLLPGSGFFAHTTSSPNRLLCGSLKDLHGAAHFAYDVDIKWAALDAHLAFNAI